MKKNKKGYKQFTNGIKVCKYQKPMKYITNFNKKIKDLKIAEKC